MHVQEELKILEKSIAEIINLAKSFNLDFYNMYFEICPAEIIYSFGSYGMPTRFSHWTFGKAYHRMKSQYDYNLSRIYEMVINTDPCYAFLLEGNSPVQNKMVAAHVLGHCDFFKNNYYFRKTSRSMVESMSLAADRIRAYEFKYGLAKVEGFLDAVISLQENIDPSSHIHPNQYKKNDFKKRDNNFSYDDLWSLDKDLARKDALLSANQSAGDNEGAISERNGSGQEWDKTEIKKFPEQPEKDLLLFVMLHGRDLEDWQRDIIAIIRDEMLYFWPQMQTKIMNEGWATYWHMRIMRAMELPEEEALEFAKTHAGVVQKFKYQINPYHLGLKIFEDIEKRWNNPTEEDKARFDRKPGEGKEKIFEVRETENDLSFIRNYLTKELIEENDLYLFKKIGYDWRVTDKEWELVRDGIVNNLYNCGLPYIVVEDGDFSKQGELYLKHVHEGVDLDIYYLSKTLPYVYQLWGRKVHLETIVDGKKTLFTCSKDKVQKRYQE